MEFSYKTKFVVEIIEKVIELGEMFNLKYL
jgi:hypothetical protein